jgi:paired amphipathic helix protein Sin3a
MPGTPKLIPQTPKSDMPGLQAGGADNATDSMDWIYSPASQMNSANSDYLDAVRIHFWDTPDIYNHFMDIMLDFKNET